MSMVLFQLVIVLMCASPLPQIMQLRMGAASPRSTGLLQFHTRLRVSGEWAAMGCTYSKLGWDRHYS